MRRLGTLVLAAAALGCFLCAGAQADYVLLANGKILFGKVKVTADTVRLETFDGFLTLPLWRVTEVKVAGEVSEVKAERPKSEPEPVAKAAETPAERPTESRPLLSITEKKKVYVRLVKAERKAREQAERDYPISSLEPGYTRKELQGLLNKRLDAQMMLLGRLREEIGERYHLNDEEMTALFDEARTNGWAKS